MLNRKFLRNKRGDIPTTIFVFLVLFLAASSLFVFITNSGKVSEKISYSRTITEIYVSEEQLKFFFTQLLRDKIKESWEGGNNAYFESNIQEKIAFEINSIAERKLKEKKKDKMFNEISEDYWNMPAEKALDNIRERINNDKQDDDFFIAIDSDMLNFQINNIILKHEDADKIISVQRIADINITLNITEIAQS